jgi:hypothetical protein
MSGHRARMVALALTLAPVAALPVVAPGLTGGSHASASRPLGPRTPTVAAMRPVMAAQTSTSAQTARATASAATWRTRLTASFNRMRPALPARSVGVAVVVVGRSDSLTLGTWRGGPAWSTIKVPLSIATLQHADSASTRTRVKKAVTRSDNAAAEALWARLGSGRRAASRVNAVLARDGDRHTRTQWRKVRAAYTPFGQTTWSLADQLRFTTGLACDRHAALVRTDMGAVVSSQRWGLGRLAHARIKGGWGPDTSGRYLVRQLALVPRGRELVAVVVAVEPSGGSFAQGVRALDEVAGWLRTSLPSLPSSSRTC